MAPSALSVNPERSIRLRFDTKAVLMAGIVAGTVDIGSAAVINWRDPLVIMRAIASGVLGPASFKGGIRAAAFGLVLQWLISILIAAIYVFCAERIGQLRRGWVAGGLITGIASFVVMNYVVVPLSAVGKAPHFTPVMFIANLAAILLYGLIIAFVARVPAQSAGPLN